MSPQRACPACSSPVAAGQGSCPACGCDSSKTPVPSLDSDDVTTPAGLSPSSQAIDGDARFPERIGDFRILGLMGRGGAGVVYRAYQESMRRTVALKVLDAGAEFWSSEVTRFERKRGRQVDSATRMLCDLRTRSSRGSRYIVMELVEGRSLAEFIKDARVRRAHIDH